MSINIENSQTETLKAAIPEKQPEITQNLSDSQPKAEDQEQINWKKFREQREIDRKQKVVAEEAAQKSAAEAKALKEAMEALLNKNQPSQTAYNEPMEETEDERIDKKVNAALAKQKALNEEQQRQKEVQEIPTRLAQTYNDFEKVCTQENLDYFEFHHPEIAAAFDGQPDSFRKWQNIYKALKKYIPNTESKALERKAEKNFNKPMSMSATGDASSQGMAPHKLDDAKRAQNWERMRKAMKSAN